MQFLYPTSRQFPFDEVSEQIVRALEARAWCGTTSNIPGERSRTFADQLLKLTPKDARGVYVADHAAYTKRRAEISAATKLPAFTQQEIADFIRVRACTIVPITEYTGNYEDPIYHINREIAFDEVEVIGLKAGGY